ncbi:MAG: sensor histidine kinase [Alphaproteobacteria bacterium]|nr:sensor histidine kinase [Alphaproteobacteria bacterium]
MRGDRSLLLQLLANLIENVLKHTPVGTDISLTLHEDHHVVSLSIGDRGPGIPLDMRTRVFERFFRLEKSRTTRGSGLGLSLVSAIARAHDAMVEMTDNEPGLRVTIRFHNGP